MKLEILRSAYAVTQKILMDLAVGVMYLGRVEQQIKVDFYLFCLVCFLYLFFQKNVLESNNAQATNTKIKLLYSTVNVFLMLFLTRFQAQHLSKKP